MTQWIGLDVGGTKLLVARADEAGVIRARAQAPTPGPLAEGLDALPRMIAEVVDPQSDGGAPEGIGVAIGGPLDRARGTVSPLHQPAWRDVPLRALLEERWRCPVTIDVDTNAAVLGEHRFADEGAARLLYLTVSTGIGGGFLCDGELYRGAGGGHPEVGHQSVPMRCSHPARVECECGAPDCLEALASGNGIRRVYGKAAADLSEAEWDEVGFHLGQGLRNLATVLRPDVIVLGGGVAIGGGAALLARIEAVLAEHLRLVPVPRVRLTRLGTDTALRGAIALAMGAR